MDVVDKWVQQHSSDIQTDPTLRIGRPQALFEWPQGLIHNFDVSPDGQWFVLIQTDPDSAPDKFRVVRNWSQELQGLFGSN